MLGGEWMCKMARREASKGTTAGTGCAVVGDGCGASPTRGGAVEPCQERNQASQSQYQYREDAV